MIINVTPDKEKIKSILNLAKSREHFISSVNIKEFSTIAAENYYEIIKELASALILLGGLKAAGESAHKDMIDYLINYKEFSEYEVFLINDLRIRRNNSQYEGKKIEANYIENNKKKLIEIIRKLKEIINKKL